MIETLLFWGCALCAIAGAIGAATVRNLFHAALLLGLALVGTAGLYLFLEAQWLACVQVVVYIGGILVLVLFATLFSADVMGAVQRTPWHLRIAGSLGAVLAAVLALRLLQTVLAQATALDRTRSTPGVPDVLDGDAIHGNAIHGNAIHGNAIDGHGAAVGDLLVTSWLVPFLAAGFLLTIALVAAIATVQRFRRPTGSPPLAPMEASRG